MNQVPHITQEHWNNANRAVPVYATFVGVFNKAIEIALAEANAEQEQPSTLNFEGLSFVEIAAKAIELEMIRQSDKAVQEFEVMESELEQPLITAEEARKLGAGKAEYQYQGSKWDLCGYQHVYNDFGKYRAIKQPKPVEPHAAQEQPLISAEEARKLGAGKAEYHKPVSAYQSLNEWDVVGYQHEYSHHNKYRAIKQPKLIPLDWKDVPAGVAVCDLATDVIWLMQGCGDDNEVLLINQPKNPFGTRFITTDCIELAPASEQPWIPVIAPPEGLTVEYSRFLECLRITGLAEGWVLK